MEMTVRYAKNADADVDASYLRNLPLIKLLQQEPVNTEDWDVLLSATPNGEDKLLEACKIESASEERKNLLALGLAARTFNFSANPVTKQLKCGDTLRSAGEYACSEDADIFAMWYVLRTLTDYLRLNFNENLRALTSAMGAMNKIRARYTQIVGRLPKIDAC